MISFIVSAYNRPDSLVVALATIAAQTEPHETIVCYNGPDDLLDRHQQICKEYGAKLVNTGKLGAYCCYSSAELVIERGIAKGEYFCFPSDDSIYFACFSDMLMRAARLGNWDLVYCNMVYDPMFRLQEKPAGRYQVLDVEPQLNRIDKTGFIMKASWFEGFPGKRRGGPAASDGLLVEELVQRGIRHGKVPAVLLVHQ